MVHINSTYNPDLQMDHIEISHGSHIIVYDIPVSKELSMEEFCSIMQSSVNKVLLN